MILKASQRGGGRELARHLMNMEMNDHVTVHEIRGFIGQTLEEALEEAYAVSKGTRCRQYLFSLSLNPPELADVSIDDFEDAIAQIEAKLGLIGHPRIVVFHEKSGRRHCHAVWLRIDTRRMVALNMAHYKLKLQQVARGLFLKHGWPLPRGFRKAKDRTKSRFHAVAKKQQDRQKGKPEEKPSFSLPREAWQQAQRLKEDPKALKALFTRCWEQSDGKTTFARALQEHGYYLARGGRRGFVAVDFLGNVYSLSRWLDVSTRALKARLGRPEDLPAIERAREYLGARMTEDLHRHLAAAKLRAAQRRDPVMRELKSLVRHQRDERQQLVKLHHDRWERETLLRARNLSHGLGAVWDKMTGKYQITKEQNEAETLSSLKRDREEMQALVRAHLAERRELQKTISFYHDEYLKELTELKKSVAAHIAAETSPPQQAKQPVTDDSQEALTQKIEDLESRLSAMTGDIASLQSALESQLISEEARARIRVLLERAVAKIQAKIQGEQVQEQKKSALRREELDRRMVEYTVMVRQYAVLQERQRQQQARYQAEYAFSKVIRNMGPSLNGIPLYAIKVMPPPPGKWPDEPAIVKSLRKYNMGGLAKIVLKSPSNASDPKDRPPLDPPMAVVEHRQNVLVVKEMLIRAGDLPRGNGDRRPQVKPVSELSGTVIKLSDVKI
ncbi:MAG: hypothetical protein GC185_06695 [Alphaproteobacteria bacterium]|nr:hypothetical protein [Alphaproteobacteria bacterium]